MSRLIDANALIEFFGCPEDDRDRSINHIIDKAPTIDAVRWAPVVWFEGLYEVSEYGHVRNTKGKILRQQIKRYKNTDYKRISLYKDGAYKHLSVHRLVAEAFLEKRPGCDIVNHKDEDGTNNWVGNLEWCDRSYNSTYCNASPSANKKRCAGVSLSDEHRKKISAGLLKHYSKHEVWNKGRPMSAGARGGENDERG